jgi:PAS domain S-box-containing protein
MVTVTDYSDSGHKLEELEAEILRLKREKEDLGENVARYRDVASRFPGFVLHTLRDKTGLISIPFLSENAVAILGVSAEEIQSDFTVLLELVSDEDRKSVEELVTGTKGPSTDRLPKVEMRSRTGEKKWFEATANRHMLADGAVLWDCTFLEISGQVEVEEANRESARKNREFFDRANDVIALVQDAEIKYINLRAREIFGLSPEDMIGKQVNEYIHPEELETLLDRYNRRMAGEDVPNIFEARLLRSDGKKIDVEINGGLIEYRGGAADLIIVRDITERKWLENLTAAQRDLGLALSATNKLSEGIELCLNAAIEISRMDVGGIYLVNDETGELVLARHSGNTRKFVEKVSRYHVDSKFFKFVMTGGPLFAQIDSPNVPDKEIFEEEGIKSLALMPISHREKIIACMNLGTRTARELPPATRVALESIAAQIGSSIVRLKAEEALQESEEKYRKILEDMEEGYFENDLYGNILFMNDSTARIMGSQPDRVLGSNFRDNMDRETADQVFQAYNRVYRTGMPDHNVNYKLILDDGTERFLELSVSLRRDSQGKKIGFRGIFRDVTEKRQAEEILRKEKEKFQVLVEESPFGITIISQGGRYEYINPKFHEIFGYTLEDVPTGAEWFRKAFPDPELKSQAISAWENDVQEAEGGEVKPRTFNVVCKDGSVRTIHFISVTMETGVQFIFYEDITEKTRLEAKLQQAEKMEAIGTLAGGVAHDLNNVLSGIVSYPELLLLDLPEESPLRQPLLTIQESGTKAAAIVQDLLTLARRGAVNTKVVNLNDIVTDYLDSLEYEKMKSYHTHVNVRTTLDPDLLNIIGSPVHLSKTVMNLISNAAEATAVGEIRITTKNEYIENPLSEKGAFKAGDYAVLEVSDTGSGILKDDMERIFEPFFTKKAMGRSGTGLGMTVVWSTVNDHNGFIDVQSERGKGSTFSLFFPITHRELDEEKTRISIESYKGNGESVLVVDDQKTQREIAASMLDKLGYRVTTVASGEEAIEVIAQNPPDLIVLDMIMTPGMDGLETYEKLIKIRPGQRAILASGFSETNRVRAAQELGAGSYLRKPYTLENLGLAAKTELESKSWP